MSGAGKGKKLKTGYQDYLVSDKLHDLSLVLGDIDKKREVYLPLFLRYF